MHVRDVRDGSNYNCVCNAVYIGDVEDITK